MAKLGFSGDGGRNGVSETVVVVRLSVEMMFLGIAFAVLTRIIGEDVDGDYIGSCNNANRRFERILTWWSPEMAILRLFSSLAKTLESLRL